ncbi:GNAT family N-acetyltransferase [Erwinia psidii]|uniref:N-acetyltransferase n=1 Tax=Erwinia psidii TaxID=69224 RepID=A0A3N6UNR5_9GAMM|nr:GNAT family N-acetyltransferase [Erwinia psidii]MCX8955757.1 N-acetyltransferase [Erwinia psidii]MCX8961685.1 N-acetyltransferase [Erwinia psidii]MCX8965787.1 N-acetyltransferase [Erwinia psidii]RQM37599.1 N-acetyltransferase [Erwinia psidii]
MSTEFRAMSSRHLAQAVSLTQNLKWPHRLDDWQQALSLGEGIVAEEDGKLVGTILWWRWGDAYASLGLVIVADDWQGKGIGRRLMQAALAKLVGYHVRLHATVMGKGLYETLGFIATGVIEQHQCRELPEVKAVSPAEGVLLRPACREDAAMLVALEQLAHGQHRPMLIDSLLNSSSRFLLLERAGRIVGFACQRPFGHGEAIGPVIAEDLPQAKVLVSHLLSGLGGQFVRMDTERQTGLGDWLTTQGMPEVDHPIIMIRGTPWQPDGARAFGLMTQAMA